MIRYPGCKCIAGAETESEAQIHANGTTYGNSSGNDECCQ